jgi:uncharacterized membrane protein
MRQILLAIVFVMAAMPAFADIVGWTTTEETHHSAPAPLIGAGLPVAMIVGGAWIGYRLLKRRASKNSPRE